MTDQQTLFETQFKPRPIKRGSPDAQRLKVGELKATQRSLTYLRKQGWWVDWPRRFSPTETQQAYIDELLRQRAELVDRLHQLFCCHDWPAVASAQAAVKRFLGELKEPGPPKSPGGNRKDLFGFIDILAFRDDEMLGVQTTSFPEIATHLREFRRDDEVRLIILDWIAGKHRNLVIHGWQCMEVAKKRGGGTKAEWQVTERVVEAADLIALPPFRMYSSCRGREA